MEEMTDSQVDYLRTILELSEEKEAVRSVDIAKRLQYSKPSVHRAVEGLEAKGYLCIGNGKCIILTDTGRKVAEASERKTDFFAKLLVEAGIEKSKASAEARKLSHAVTEEIFTALLNFYRPGEK